MISAVLVFITLISQILALTPVFLFRWILSKICKLFRPDLNKIVDADSSAHTMLPCGKDEARNLIISATIEGELNYEEILKRISKVIFHSTGNSKQELFYPEFQMYYERWFGFPFWKFEENFCVENHVRRAVWSSLDLNFEIEYLRIPFEPFKSPWEILLVEKDEKSNHWKFLFKFHHYLADGQSIFNAFGHISDNHALFQKREPSFPHVGILKRVAKFTTFPFVAAYEMVRDQKDMEVQNLWALQTSEMSVDSRVFFKSELIPCELIKRVTLSKKVSFTSVLLAGVSGGIRNFLENEGDTTIPPHVSTLFPAPIPSHGEGLCNEFTSLLLKLPVGCKNPERRLKLCEQNLARQKASTAGPRFFYLSKLFGCLPNIIQTKVLPDKLATIQLGIFPGPAQQFRMNGQDIVDMHYMLWWSKLSPLCITIMSYNGGIRIIVNSDPVLFPTTTSLQPLVQEIEKEIQTIAQMCAQEK